MSNIEIYKVEIRTFFDDIPFMSESVEELMQNLDLTKARLKERAKKLSLLFADNITEEELHYIIRNALKQVEKTLFDECKEVLKEKKGI